MSSSLKIIKTIDDFDIEMITASPIKTKRSGFPLRMSKRNTSDSLYDETTSTSAKSIASKSCKDTQSDDNSCGDNSEEVSIK